MELPDLMRAPGRGLPHPAPLPLGVIPRPGGGEGRGRGLAWTPSWRLRVEISWVTPACSCFPGLVSGDCDSQGPPWSQSRCWRDRRRYPEALGSWWRCAAREGG